MKKELFKIQPDAAEIKEFMDTQPIKLIGNEIRIDLEKFIEHKYKDLKPPKVLLSEKAYMKIMHLVLKQSNEIAWHGVVEKHEAVNSYLITDILVYPQVISMATVDASDNYSKWLIKNHSILNQIRMQGHSHVNMPAVPSATDKNYYREMISQIDDYYIFMIINKTQNIYMEFYDCQNNIIFLDVPMYILSDGTWSLAEFYKEAEKNFETPKVKTYNYANNALKSDALPETVEETAFNDTSYYEHYAVTNRKKGFPYELK